MVTTSMYPAIGLLLLLVLGVFLVSQNYSGLSSGSVVGDSVKQVDRVTLNEVTASDYVIEEKSESDIFIESLNGKRIDNVADCEVNDPYCGEILNHFVGYGADSR